MARCNSTDTFWLVKPLAHWITNQCRWKLASENLLKFQMHHFLQCFGFWMGTDPSYLKIKFKNIWVWSYMAALLIILCHLLSMLPRTKVSLLNSYLFITALSCIHTLHTYSWNRSVQLNEGISTCFPYLVVSLPEVPIQHYLCLKKKKAKHSSSFQPNAFQLVSLRHQSPSHQSCSSCFLAFFTEHTLTHFKHSHKINLCKIISSSSQFPTTSQVSTQRKGHIQDSLALLLGQA